jgi:hypothetical protein
MLLLLSGKRSAGESKNMKKDYVKLSEHYFQSHLDLANTEANPHRRAIIFNYIEHAALEYTKDRWHEILDARRTVEHPVYDIRMGTPHVVHLEGQDAVRGFYSALKEGVLTNEFINFAVGDWGFSSFLKIHLFLPGRVLVQQGTPIDDPAAFYHVEMPLVGMYWDYDESARLISENVYDLLPPIVTKMDPKDAPSAEAVDRIVRKYLPH